MRNYLQEFVDQALYKRVHDRFGQHTPLITLGWSDEVHERLREARQLPLVLDEYTYTKVFGQQVKRPRSRRLYGGKLDVEPDVRSIMNHYIEGLLRFSQASHVFDIPDDLVTSEPKGALGYGFVNHQGLLEFGLTLTQDKPFPEFIVEAATMLLNLRYDEVRKKGWREKDFGLDLTDYTSVRASYPRGKNSGLPWLVSGSNRLINNLALAINASLAGILVRGYDPREMFDGMLLGYVVFSRFQRYGKPVPAVLEGHEYMTTGVEPRRRIINATPKAIAMAVKPLVKWLTMLHLEMPEFSQDRRALAHRIRSCPFVFASDASRFDLRSGGVKLQQGLKVIELCARHTGMHVPESVYELMYLESKLPTMVTLDTTTGKESRWSDKPSLRSGASTTSRVGSIMNLMYDMYVTSKAEDLTSAESLTRYYVRHEPSVIQGDDLMKFPPDAGARERYLAALPCLSDVGMSAELEVPTKFLGYNVTDPLGRSNQRGLWHSSNPLANMFFPERHRDYAVASMLSRYIILKVRRADDVVDELTRVSRDPDHAMKWYKSFWEDMMPHLRPHYATHPSGRARVYFSTLKDPSTLSTLQLAKEIKHDEDELLRHIAQTARFEMNTYLFGEQLADWEEPMGDVDVVTASLDEMRTLASPVGERGVRAQPDTVEAMIRRDPRVLPLLRLFSSDCDKTFVQAWRNALPQVSREIRTAHGRLFVANL